MARRIAIELVVGLVVRKVFFCIASPHPGLCLGVDWEKIVRLGGCKVTRLQWEDFSHADGNSRPAVISVDRVHASRRVRVTVIDRYRDNFRLSVIGELVGNRQRSGIITIAAHFCRRITISSNNNI